jgi:hypothetical protein
MNTERDGIRSFLDQAVTKLCGNRAPRRLFMDTKVERDVRFLKIYAAVTSLLCAVFLLEGFAYQENRKQKFEEIDVERINIVEKDGRLRMVISNRERQHPGVVDGKVMPRPSGRPPGMIFFNHQGNEAGGLIFDENGGNGHFLQLTFDKSRQDQTLGLRHLESDNGQYFAGLQIWDRPHTSLADFVTRYEAVQKRPNGPDKDAAMKELGREGFSPERVTVGKLRDKTATIVLSDGQGRPRIRMAVAENGDPILAFLDETGKITYRLPEQSQLR